MSRTVRIFIQFVVVALTSVVASSTLSAQAINVSLTPSAATVSVGQTFQFTAKVTPGSKSGVTWSVNGLAGGNATVGTIASSGLYTAPAVLPSPSSVTVSAISIVDPSVSVTATVTVVSNGPSVTVSPSTASVHLYQTQQFTATVSGLSNTSLTWSVNGMTGGSLINGTISNSGLYTAPAAVPPSPVTVTATSVADSARSGQAAVTVIVPTLTISPALTNVSTSQTAQFSVAPSGGSSKKPATYTWSVNGILGGNSVVGTISNKGLYTAPALPPSPAKTTIMAISSSNQSGLASATVVANVSVTVAPANASVLISKTQQFTSTVSGTPNTAVNWNVNGVAGGNSTSGTISSSGLYTAPDGVPTPASVTVTATSAADTTKSANATITVSPTIAVSVSPASVTLSNSQIQQFAATVTGSSNSLVVWSLSAALGAISASGQYKAPSSIAGPQTVTVTATTLVDPIVSGSATVSLVPDTTPPSVTMTSPAVSADPTATLGGNVTLAATASDNIAVVGVRFLVDGLGVGAEVTAPPYSVAWSSTTYQNGPHTLSAVARDAAGNTATASETVMVSNTTTQVILPVEVVGSAGTTQTVTVNLASPPVSGAKLWMQIHNLKYQTEASVQVNGGLWLPINDSTVTLEGLASAYGGIGGGFSTIKMRLNLPTGALVPGPNTVTFRFNNTDGVTSGFRVLNFNFLDTNGNQLVGADAFVQDDPNSWQPPSTLADDIAAGQLLWQTANLTTPGIGTIQAKCGSCHTQDGRDLKYFNYSNNSIRARSLFHGLSTEQADQIVSYIRSLNVPNPGRPWNPPYQPGPGLDSLPVENWAAGAGLEWVLDSDVDMVSYLMPSGSTANWAPTANLNQRELPIAFQLPDWNRWLPIVHPLDAFGSAFSSSALYLNYLGLRSNLRATDPTSYQANKFNIWNWTQLAHFQFEGTVIKPASDPAWQSPTFANSIYSIELWSMVKNWEINQEFGLEGMASTVFGPQAESRAWYSPEPFFASPNMIQMPHDSVGNGQQIVFSYFSMMWYQLQLILNDGNGTFVGNTPIDFPYVYNFVGGESYNANGLQKPSQGSLMIEWLIKGLQASQYDSGPDHGSNGWQPWVNDPSVLAAYPNSPNIWSGLTSSQITDLLNGYLNIWFAKIKTFTPQQFYTGGWATPTETIDPNRPQGTFGDRVANMFYGFTYFGVDRTLLGQINAWAQTVWPTFTWPTMLNITCTLGAAPWVTCQ